MLIDKPIWTSLKAHSTRIAAIGGFAEIILQFFLGSGLPWWAVAGLFGLVIVGRVVKQPSISGEEVDDAA